MPTIRVHLTDEEFIFLERAAKELERPISDLAEAAVADAISRYTPAQFGLTQRPLDLKGGDFSG